jgi:hypothetical protein
MFFKTVNNMFSHGRSQITNNRFGFIWLLQKLMPQTGYEKYFYPVNAWQLYISRDPCSICISSAYTDIEKPIPQGERCTKT